MQHIPELPDPDVERVLERQNSELAATNAAIEAQFERDPKRAAVGWMITTLIFLAVLLLFSATAGAQSSSTCATSPTVVCAWNEDCLEWARPTTYTDNSPLAATDIASYVVESAPVGSTTWTQLGTVTAPVQGYKRTGLRHGEAYQYRVIAVLKSNVRSAPSNVCNHVTTEPAPNPPVLKTVEANAYEIKTNSTGSLVATRIGLVPVGTSCSERQQKVGTVTYTQVPRAAVDMVNFSTTKNAWVPEVWARCA